MKRALLIPAEDRMREVEVPEGDEALAVLQGFVGGYIELVPNPNGVTVYCNEEGKIHGLPFNTTATLLFGKWLQWHDYLAGDVLVIGPPDREGNDTSLDDSWFKWLKGEEEV